MLLRLLLCGCSFVPYPHRVRVFQATHSLLSLYSVCVFSASLKFWGTTNSRHKKSSRLEQMFHFSLQSMDDSDPQWGLSTESTHHNSPLLPYVINKTGCTHWTELNSGAVVHTGFILQSESLINDVVGSPAEDVTLAEQCTAALFPINWSEPPRRTRNPRDSRNNSEIVWSTKNL